MTPHAGSLGHTTASRMGKWIHGIAPGDWPRQVATRSLRARLDAVLHYLPLAAERAKEDIEPVHQLRVGTRRAEAALKLYADLLPRRRAAWIQKQLKRVRRTANKARDCDVLARQLADSPLGDEGARWLARVRAERAQAQGPIVAISERLLRHGRCERRVEELLRRVRPRRGEAVQLGLRFGDWARARLRPIVRRFFAASPSAVSEVAALHRFRIRAKELRYAMELLAEAFPPDFRAQLYPVVEALQDRLGEINDLATAQSRLRERIEQAGRAPEATRLHRLFEDRQGQLEQAHTKFLDWWTPRLVETFRAGFKKAEGRQVPPTSGAYPPSASR